MHPPAKKLHKTPVGGCQLLAAGAYEAECGKDFPFHRHDVWELVYYRSGAIEFLLGQDEVIETCAGMLIFAPPGIAHSERARTSYANYFLFLEVPAHPGWPRFCVDHDQTLFRLCSFIVEEFEHRRPQRTAMLALLMQQLEIALARAVENVRIPGHRKIVARAEALMASQLGSKMTMAEIARECGTSPSSLRNHFARVHHQSPREKLRDLRVEKAVMLLTTSDLKLDSIADLTGFYSASHLSRHVQKALGKSPGAVRIAAEKRSRRE